MGKFSTLLFNLPDSTNSYFDRQQFSNLFKFEYLSQNEYQNDEDKLVMMKRAATKGRKFPCKCKPVYDEEKQKHVQCVSEESCSRRNRDVECDLECGPLCLNRPFTDDVFKNASLGIIYKPLVKFGIVTNRSIKKDDFVIEYVGEVLRTKDWPVTRDSTYRFDVCGTPFTICSLYKGNWSKLTNSSHFPNLYCAQYYTPNQIRIVLIAKRNILAGEELTWDYGTKYPIPVCACGFPTCPDISKLQPTLIKYYNQYRIDLDNGWQYTPESDIIIPAGETEDEKQKEDEQKEEEVELGKYLKNIDATSEDDNQPRNRRTSAPMPFRSARKSREHREDAVDEYSRQIGRKRTFRNKYNDSTLSIKVTKEIEKVLHMFREGIKKACNVDSRSTPSTEQIHTPTHSPTRYRMTGTRAPSRNPPASRLPAKSAKPKWNSSTNLPSVPYQSQNLDTTPKQMMYKHLSPFVPYQCREQFLGQSHNNNPQTARKQPQRQSKQRKRSKSEKRKRDQSSSNSSNEGKQGRGVLFPDYKGKQNFCVPDKNVQEKKRLKNWCPICEIQLPDAWKFQRHMDAHYNPDKYKCPECPRTFSDETNYKHHIKGHGLFDETNGYRCLNKPCNRTFTRSNDRKRHMEGPCEYKPSPLPSSTSCVTTTSSSTTSSTE